MGVFLAIAYVFCLCSFLCLGILWTIEGDLERGFMFLSIVFLMITSIYIFIKKGNRKNVSKKEWIDRQACRFGLKNNKFVLCGSNHSDHLIYTNDNRLVLMNPSKGKVREVSLRDILDIKLEILQRVKNTRKIISLVPTYNRNIKTDGVKVSVIANSNTYTVEYIQGSDIYTGSSLLDSSKNESIMKKIEDIERFKLIIEDDIKKLKHQENVGCISK